MARLFKLTDEPIRVHGPIRQELRLARLVGPFNSLSLSLRVLEGRKDIAVRILTGDTTETEDGWVSLGEFAPSAAPNTAIEVFSNPLRFVRWEVTNKASATILVAGVARQT